VTGGKEGQQKQEGKQLKQKEHPDSDETEEVTIGGETG